LVVAAAEPVSPQNGEDLALAEPQAPGQVPPGLPGRAEVQGHLAQAGQAAGDLRPGADLLQDRQR
jgi:hypothetical protein